MRIDFPIKWFYLLNFKIKSLLYYTLQYTKYYDMNVISKFYEKISLLYMREHYICLRIYIAQILWNSHYKSFSYSNYLTNKCNEAKITPFFCKQTVGPIRVFIVYENLFIIFVIKFQNQTDIVCRRIYNVYYIIYFLWEL